MLHKPHPTSRRICDKNSNAADTDLRVLLFFVGLNQSQAMIVFSDSEAAPRTGSEPRCCVLPFGNGRLPGRHEPGRTFFITSARESVTFTRHRNVSH
jgi:hypothetical protein